MPDPIVPQPPISSISPVSPPGDDADLLEKAVEHGGQKMVSLAAVQDERRKAKEYRAQAESEKAARAQLEEQIGAVKPYLQAIARMDERTLRQLVRPDGAPPNLPPGPTTVPSPDDDPEMVESARDMELYKSDGTPDAVRAARILARLDKRSERIGQTITQRAMAPMQHNVAAARGQSRRERAYAMQSASKESLNELFSRLPDEIVGGMDENAFQWALLTASGLDVKSGRVPVGVPQEPIFSESPGGPTHVEEPLSELERKVAKTMGVSVEDFRKLSKDHATDGRGAKLE